jgi:hypothetical protein
MEATCTYETSAISSTSTGYNNPRRELTSIIKHRESLKLVMIGFLGLGISMTERHGQTPAELFGIGVAVFCPL